VDGGAGAAILVVGSEQATRPDDFQRLYRALLGLLTEEDQSLLKDWMTWWWKVLSSAHDVPMPPLPDNPQELPRMIEHRFKEWEDQVRQQALQQGRQEGRQEGKQEGLQEGLQVGVAAGRRETLRQMVAQAYAARFGAISPEVKAAIDAADEATLQGWFPRVIVAPQAEVLALLLGLAQG
jgi:flagellar biosynthesis/type III secretory pathway protein FliH